MWGSFSRSLWFWKDQHVLTFSTIDDYELAKSFSLENFNNKTSGDVVPNTIISNFKELAPSLCKKGVKTCLSNRAHGDHETFCAHVLGWCLSDIVESTYKKT